MGHRNGEVSFWMAASHSDDAPPPQSSTAISFPALPQATQDLVIIGAGFTGLWAAYYASLEHPDWTITIVEAREPGYGASGRNGGWLSTLIPGNRAIYAAAAAKAGKDSRQAVISFQEQLFESIDEVLDVCTREGIDAHAHRGGNLKIAQTAAGLHRVEEICRADREHGYGPGDVQLLDAGQARDHVNAANTHGGLFYPRTAAIDPALLCRGLARLLRERGVRILTDTPASAVQATAAGPLVVTDRGTVAGAAVLVCVEAYSDTLRAPLPALAPAQLIPVNSSIIVTDPLSDAEWSTIGWEQRECLSDSAHTFVYAQRTFDGRIAIGGRGAPYAFNSGLPGDGEVDSRTTALLESRLRALFPQLSTQVAHAWRGVIGVTRDWCAGVSFDEATRIGTARGYAGHGVTATHLAARTLLDCVEGRRTARTALPWMNHDSGRWEPEPVRWAGVHTMYRLFTVADAWEEARGATQTSLLARVGEKLTGLG